VDCQPAGERNLYFTGKPMTARDFIDEQRYFLTRHWLHNRLLHGWGIICGLRVRCHWNPDCRDRWVIVEPGIALDCCGRELILPRRTPIRLAEDEDDPPQNDLLIYLQYAEEPTECTPVLYACEPNRAEPGRVREVAEVGIVPLDEVEDGCWRSRGESEGHPCRKDCDDDQPEPSWGCLDASCPCGHRVPLAVIDVAEGEDDTARATPFEIDDEGVWRIPPPRAYLTSIAGINWPHGGELNVADLEDLDRTLKIWFDRPLRAGAGEATGINRYTFVVQYGNIQRGLEFLDPLEPPTLEEDGCVAAFRIDDDYFKPGRTLAENDFYVTLKCDFLLDCHGLAVDGDHIGGRLPSGDGIEGGLFESWFRVIGDGGGERGRRSK
jgi:hypothetical protein